MSAMLFVFVVQRAGAGSGNTANRRAFAASRQCADRSAANRSDADPLRRAHVAAMTDSPGVCAITHPAPVMMTNNGAPRCSGSEKHPCREYCGYESFSHEAYTSTDIEANQGPLVGIVTRENGLS